jgi:lysophospholipase L1-like esterase
LLVLFPTAALSDDFFRDGDRVVFLGSTIIEREQKYGYWETALTIANPKKNITFRNLGWSGDTVWGEARASFDPPAVGYKRLVEHTLALKPTVIFLCYGTNESFAGEAGLAKFVAQYNKLLDDLSPSKARFVLMAPPPFEEAAWHSGRFEERQRDLRHYAAKVEELARKRQTVCCPQGVWDPGIPTLDPYLTDDGMHFTDMGYYGSANVFHSKAVLGWPKEAYLKLVKLSGTTPVTMTQPILPFPVLPQRAATLWSVEGGIKASDLKAGKYTLEINGKSHQTADANHWMGQDDNWDYDREGARIRKGPSLAQSEKLRQTIVEKNRLYFNRWRPANETYLFGFRKHEQGNNAVEIPKFDPLIEKLEADIARLRVPVKHTYQLVPAK